VGTKIRLQVFLSRNGICSRRKAFEIIQQGHVKINGVLIREPSTAIDPQKDRVAVDEKAVVEKKYEYVLLNKSKGVVTTKKDRFALKTIADIVPKGLKHLNPAGRLDKDTEGLILLTNDGELLNALMHPKFDVGKTYQVRIKGELKLSQKNKLQKGVVIDGKETWPAEIFKVKKSKATTEFFITIHEGRNRQIRKMIEKIGSRVIFLRRIAQGPLKIGLLRTGSWRRCTKDEIKKLEKIKMKKVQ